MTTDDLDPTIDAALRSVPPVEPTTRDAHIAAALEQFVMRRPQFGRIAIGAAAALVLIFGAFVIGRSSASSPQSPVVSAPASTIPKAALSSCTDQFDSDAELVHSYEVNDVDFAVVKVNDQTFILEVNTCTYITQFSAAAD